MGLWCQGLGIVFLFLLILPCSIRVRFTVEASRPNPEDIGIPEAVSDQEKKMTITARPRIGSRPPRCEIRCRSCGHCEAIQVPINPQHQLEHTVITKNNSTFSNNIAYARGDGESSYKPMSWKCKCGNFIFNP